MRKTETPILFAILVAVALIVSFLPAPFTTPKAWGAVSPPSVSREVSDELAALSVRSLLLEKLGTDALRISVDVAGDTAILTGQVAQRSSRKLAGEIARSVHGIARVDNRVTEKAPEPAMRNAEDDVKDAALLTKVKTVLVTDIGVNALKIDVSATDGVVTLRGKLGKPDVDREAVAKARSVAGVEKVIDLLE